MKRMVMTLFLTGALVLSLGVLGFAQMGKMNKPAESNQNWQKPMGMNESRMLDQMSNNEWMMSTRFDSLQTMWNRMMVINNMTDIKSAMGNYQQSWKQMRQEMARQGTMYQKAIPGKENMNGMSMDQKQMLQKMDGNYEMMSSRMDSLQAMTDRMMTMKDMSELKSSMKNYQHMMMSMHDELANQGTMYKRMMAMMGDSGGMQHHRMMQRDDNK